MVMHDVQVQGVQLNATTQTKPVVLQMNREDFPNAFLQDLGAMGQQPLPAPVSSAQVVAASCSVAGTLYQPVARVVHVAVVQLNCESIGYPRLDPARVVSAGLVIRRVPRVGGASQLSLPSSSAWPWMKNTSGQFAWGAPPLWSPDDDPDPTQRPQLQSGRPELDQLLAAKALSTAMTEVSTPAFVAAPNICTAAGRTLVYGLIPTASSDASTQQTTPVPSLSDDTLLKLLPHLLKAGHHHAPQADQTVTYQYMSDDWLKANNKTDFQKFSATLRLLYSSFQAFDGSSTAQPLLDALNQHFVTMQDGTQVGMGDFYTQAASALIGYDPNDPTAGPVPPLQMPHAWDSFSHSDQEKLLRVMAPLLQSRGQGSAPPQGRYQEASRLYRVRLFFRIKGETAACPPQLVWSCYSDPFRFAAWYESGGRPAVAPVPMPDPFDPNALQSAKPTSSFVVPPSLMGAMQGASLTGLSAGTPPAGGGGGLSLNWICSFSIPLITICAFFVLNIFISLLNIVFFWMAFIKICIPFPIPVPSASPTED